MGLTNQSTGAGALKEMFEVKLESPDDIVIALAGNPNTGKSTVFNNLTGMNQHTGNWPGKTVTNAQGKYNHHQQRYILVDLPGTYSLLANSVEEQVARDFICFGNPHATVVVTDATCLERNLNLVLQIMEITDNVVVCVNLMDEAKRKKIHIDLSKLSELLGVPVVGTNARSGEGLLELKNAIEKVSSGEIKSKPKRVDYDDVLQKATLEILIQVKNLVGNQINSQWAALRLLDGDRPLLESMNAYLGIDLLKDELLKHKLDAAYTELKKENIPVEDLRDRIVSSIVKNAESIGKSVVKTESNTHSRLDRRIDSVLTSRLFGIPIMVALLGVVFWLTIEGANVPSQLLADGLFWVEGKLTDLFFLMGSPIWLHDILILGIYRTLAWVVSVMLPPMAIFFPMFTLLEDLGYLPRVAFNLDHFFKKACAHGKQALTMCMVSLNLYCQYLNYLLTAFSYRSTMYIL